MRDYARKQNQPPQQSTNLTRSHPVRFQPKLKVNTPGDKYEKEADRVAAQLTSMPAHERLQSKSVQPNDVESEAPPVVTDALRSSGQPLDSSTRAFMEPRFGHDFSRVRVHTDQTAADSARAVSALAYTVGRDVVFGAGRYAPGTAEGRHLLAHELVHVMQRRGSSDPSPLKLGGPDGIAERQATSVADMLESNRWPSQTSINDNSIAPSVQRQRESAETPGLEISSETQPGEMGVTLEDPKNANSGLTVKIQIVSGSKPAPGQADEEKLFGGKMGGHVVINLGAEGVLGFSNDESGGHTFAKGPSGRNSKFEHYTQEGWAKRTKGKQVVTFEVNLTLDQVSTLKEAFEGKPNVDYSVLGYRCASYVLYALNQAGVIKESNFKIKYILAVTPGALIRFLQHLGYSPDVEEGDERRRWNRRFKMPKETATSPK
jgi:hypothetical protein